MSEPDRIEAEASGRIRELQSRSERGLWPLALFVALSLWAHTGFRFVPSLPPRWKAVLGRPPPPGWINAVFVLYLFSAMVLSLTKMAGDGPPGSGFRHVAYLAVFYGFYHVSGALQENYWAVLVGGFALLTLEFYRNWIYYRHKIREEMARRKDRTGEGSQ